MLIPLTTIEDEKINPKYKELAVARKLQILTAPYLRRNPEFFYAGGNLPKKANAYRTKIEKEVFQSNIEKGINIPIVCKPLCEMMVDILKENNINAEIICCDTDIFKHTDVLITSENGKQYIINFLEDLEFLQTGMKTPNFASEEYYNFRYKKFEGESTTNGVKLDNIDFISQDELEEIDSALGYKKCNMYMNEVIQEIKKEFVDFRNIMADNECINEEYKMQKEQYSKSDIEKTKIEIKEKYKTMSDDDILEQKLDWIFNYFNDRQDLKGHTDFVMYYSRLLLKEVLSENEYKKLVRYDGFISQDNIELADEKIKNVLENFENPNKARFALIEIKGKNSTYMISTKSNVYAKLNKEEREKLDRISSISKSEPPSDLLMLLQARGNATPLLFHPLGSKIINEIANSIPNQLIQDERKKKVEEIANSLILTDEPITSITIPMKDGEKKTMYINENDEFCIKEFGKEHIYHYNENIDDFNIEEK